MKTEKELVKEYYEYLKDLSLEDLRERQELLQMVDFMKGNEEIKRERQAMEIALTHAVLDK